MKYDAIVVGSGFAGATAARLLAENGQKVLIIEERNHIGGNSYDCVDDNGVLVHPYGPHIFHTNEKRVFDFLCRFSPFVDYRHKVKGNIDGKIVPIPFNYSSLEICFGGEKAEHFKTLLASAYPNATKISIFDLLNSNNNELMELGDYVYEKVFAQYTAKQWGIDASMVDKSVINRVPIVLGYDDGYFSDTYQYMPKDGFANLFDNLLNHPNIKILLNTKAEKLLTIENNQIYFENNCFLGHVIFTGELDRLFNYCFGTLSYRSLRFEFETYNQDSYQCAAVINYNTSEAFTRITEFKKLTGQKLTGKTTILKEYPAKYISGSDMMPYYPINNSETNDVYAKYISLVEKLNNFHCCGRLAEFKYYNMDKVISRAMDVVEDILKQ